MNKILFISVLFLFMLLLPLFSQDLGDVNTDNAIDIIDALLVAQYYVNLDPQNFNPGAADVNCDGSIGIVDALLIARFYVGLISGFTDCHNSTPPPTPIPMDCTIPCLATTVAPEKTSDPAITPTITPLKTQGPPAPTPMAGNVYLDNHAFSSIKVCSEVVTEICAFTTGYYLSSFEMTVSFTPSVMVLDECVGVHGVKSDIEGIELSVDASVEGVLVVRGYYAQGLEPSPWLRLFSIQFIAIDFGETQNYYGNSYFASGNFAVRVREFTDTSGEIVGEPKGVSYRGIYYYSGDFDPGVITLPYFEW